MFFLIWLYGSVMFRALSRIPCTHLTLSIADLEDSFCNLLSRFIKYIIGLVRLKQHQIIWSLNVHHRSILKIVLTKRSMTWILFYFHWCSLFGWVFVVFILDFVWTVGSHEAYTLCTTKQNKRSQPIYTSRFLPKESSNSVLSCS